MGAQTKITITHDVADVAADLQSKGITAQAGKLQHINWLQSLLSRVSGGISNATLSTTIDKGDGVAATGTLTLAGVVATDTCVVGSQTFTAVASGATGNQFNVGGSDTLTAVQLVSVINTVLAGSVVASSVGAVVTITSAVQGVIGNQIKLTGNAHITASGAYCASGAAATSSSSTSTYAFGL
jgi:phage tail sheath gpL-like